MPNTLITVVAAAGLLAVTAGSVVRAEALDTVLLGNGGWEAFSENPVAGSLAWAGEDETFTASLTRAEVPALAVEFDDHAVDVELLTGLPAPEPPALVLAGMAFGGVLCGRSLLMRRRAKTMSNSSDEESRG